MKNLKKKGFTIVELVIVIAVIAILAAVLIPTFVNLTKRANESAYLQERMNQQLQDLIEKVEKQEYLTWEDFEAKLAEELAKANKENADATKEAIEKAIKAYVEKLGDELTGLSEEQVKQIIEKALEGQLTTAQVEAIVKAALEKIKLPENSSITAEQVSAIVNSAIASLRKEIGDTAITKEQMEAAITEAIKKELADDLTEDQIKEIVNGALEGFDFGGLTQEEIDKIINDALAKQEAKIEKLIADAIADALSKQDTLTAEQVKEIVNSALKDQPAPDGITKDEMEQAIADAIADALAKQDTLTEEQIKEIIDNALAEQEEKIEKLIADAIAEALKNQTPQDTLTEEEMKQAIAEALSKLDKPLTEEQIQAIIDAALGKLSCHNEWEVLPEVAPTCVSTGLSKGLKCKECGIIILEQTEIPATGEHNYVNGKCSVCEAEDPNYVVVVEVKNETELKAALAAKKEAIALVNSFKVVETITIDYDVTIDLNQKVLSYENASSLDSPLFKIYGSESGKINVSIKNGIIDGVVMHGENDHGNLIQVSYSTVELYDLKQYVRSAADGGYISAIQIREQGHVVLDGNSLIQMPGTSSETQNGNVTIYNSGNAAAISFYKGNNSSFTMENGTINVIGTGSLHVIEDRGSGEVYSGCKVALNGGTVNLTGQREDEYLDEYIVFTLRSAIDEVVVDGAAINVTGFGAGEKIFLQKRTTSTYYPENVFDGTITYKGSTQVTLSNCKQFDYKDGGKCTIYSEGGIYSEAMKTWTAQGYEYK